MAPVFGFSPSPTAAQLGRRLGRDYNQRMRGRVALHKEWMSLALIAFALAACSSSGPQPDQPAASEEIRPGLPRESATVDSGREPVAQATMPCENDATYLQDLTIPDGTVVMAGSRLIKRWSVENSGTCDWGPAHRLIRQDQGALEGADEVALFPARAGAPAILQVELRAPDEPGTYRGRWRARTPEGTFFGDEVFILVVVEVPTGTPAEVAETPTP